MNIVKVMDNGQIFNPEVLDIKPEDIVAGFRKSIGHLTALSLGSGYITESAAPHLILGAFKNLASVTFAVDGFSFE